jgi:hypothetical protein
VRENETLGVQVHYPLVMHREKPSAVFSLGEQFAMSSMLVLDRSSVWHVEQNSNQSILFRSWASLQMDELDIVMKHENSAEQ